MEPESLDLAVDIGNSSVKAGIFRQDQLLETFRMEQFDRQQASRLAREYPIKNAILCSVKKRDRSQWESLANHFEYFLELNAATPLPIQNEYQTPETLGSDRIAAVTGAYALFPNQNVLVIDAGTAITYDLLDASGHYKGGNISPGLSLRFRGLHEATGLLPLMSPQESTPWLGKNTQQAIVAGVQNGLIFEMNQYIHLFTHQYGKLTTILTGGDSNFFDNKLKYTIFAESNLVLIGLNKILKYNLYAK
jgi:type III pantothenate kinase